MVGKVASLLFSVMFLVTQTLGVAAHCVSQETAAGHAHASLIGATHTHDTTGIADGAQHTHAEHQAPAPDFDFDFAASDCTLGYVGVEPLGHSEPERARLKAPFTILLADARLGATPAQPTPPPNTTL